MKISSQIFLKTCRQKISQPLLALQRTGIAAILLLLISPPAVALNITVTKTSDSADGVCDSDCSLREAISLANSTPGNHSIFLQAATYSLTLPAPLGEENAVLDEDNNSNGDLDVHSNITIVGAYNDTLIRAYGGDRIFEVFENASLTLRWLSLRGGRHHHDGGGIRNLGTVTLKNVVMVDNKTNYGFAFGKGGAIANYGSLTSIDSQFFNNIVSIGDSNAAFGAAIYNENTLLVRDTIFRSNFANTDDVLGRGGAIYNSGNADVGRSLFIDNRGDGYGSAIANMAPGNLTVSNSTFTQNRSTEGYTEGTITNTGTATLIHVTIADNIRNYGVDNRGKLLIRNSIIVNNLMDDGSDEISNCINQGSSYEYKARGLLIGDGFNNCSANIYFDDALTGTALFYPLAKEGKGMEIFALRPLSPAIDASVGSCSSHDQRRFLRPQDGNGDGLAVCDLGSYETQPQIFPED